MANINEAFQKIIIPVEGFYSNNKNDSGGETVWGIARRKNPTAAIWTLVDGYKKIPGFPENMRCDCALRNLVILFYKQNYWDNLKLDKLDDQNIANELFDIAVNCGAGIAAVFLQRVLNVFNHQGKDYADLIVDGVIGSKTISTLNDHCNPAKILKALNALQGERYIALCEANPVNEKLHERLDYTRIINLINKSNPMFKNYFQPTPKKIQKILLAAKTFIGTIAISSFFSGNTHAAFYFLLGGAIIDFGLNCISENKTDNISKEKTDDKA